MPIPSLLTVHEESALAQRVSGTVWQPGLVANFPGVMSSREVVDDIACMFSEFGIPAAVYTEVCHKLENFVHADLQCY